MEKVFATFGSFFELSVIKIPAPREAAPRWQTVYQKLRLKIAKKKQILI